MSCQPFRYETMAKPGSTRESYIEGLQHIYIYIEIERSKLIQISMKKSRKLSIQGDGVVFQHVSLSLHNISPSYMNGFYQDASNESLPRRCHLRDRYSGWPSDYRPIITRYSRQSSGFSNDGRSC
jgi:hypothetical protein